MPRIGGLSGVTTPPKKQPIAFDPSPQQQAAFDFVVDGTGSAVLEAVAGAGKTTTLVEICKLIRGKAVFTAFNKKIADDIGRKLSEAGVDSQTVRSATFHAIGFAAWRKFSPGSIKVDGDKLDGLMEEISVPKGYRAFCKKLVSLAKQSMIGLDGMDEAANPAPWEEIVEHFELDEMLMADDQVTVETTTLAAALGWAYRLLVASNEVGDRVIDFDDMIYLPLVNKAKFDQYDWVLVDEAQDTNRARREMAKAMLKPGGRLIAVGDRHQAIYGFTGADADALDLISQEFSCIPLPLTITYRCPKAVVRHAQRWVKHIQAADSAPEGKLSEINHLDFNKLRPKPTDAILCRNTKPLVEIAFDLIRREIGCHVEGRDIGQGLLTLVRKWKTPRTVGQLREKLEEHLYEQTAKYILQGKEHKVASLRDKVETLNVLADHVGYDAPIWQLEDQIDRLFRDTTGREKPTVTLSTVHKAKGREWDRVYLYGRNRYMPSPYAKQEWEIQQERNLIYVAVTRAKKELIEVRLPLPGERAYYDPAEDEKVVLDHAKEVTQIKEEPKAIARHNPADQLTKDFVSIVASTTRLPRSEAIALIREALDDLE